MEQLITVTEQDGEQLVDARELHESLESKQEFAHWIKKRIVDNIFFNQNEDYTSIVNVIKRANGGNKQIDYALTLDTAKKVSMAEQTTKGNEVRDYFLAMEKKAHQPISQIDLIIQSAQLLKSLDNRITAIENQPQINAPVRHFSILGHCNNINKELPLKVAADYGRQCTKLCKDLGLDTGNVPDPRFGRVKTYPLNVLEEIIGE
jgi:phage anti-repressor protein